MGIRTVIIGAGPGGLAAARSLTAAGHDVRILEQAPALRTSGGSVTLWPGTIRILRQLGADPSDLGSRLTGLEVWTSDGRLRTTIDLTRAERRYGAPSVHIARRALAERLAEGVPVEYGSQVVAAAPERAEVMLADGRTVAGDVLVGADGRDSVVRRALWSEDPAERTPWVTWQTFADVPRELVGSGRTLVITGQEGMCGLSPAGPGRVLCWFEVRAAPGRPLWLDETDPMGRLKELFGDWAGLVPEVLSGVTGMAAFPHWRHKVPRVWGKGPTTLLGDAAHTMPPAMAPGTNQAVEDAWLLARSLGDLRGYERTRARQLRLPARASGAEITNQPAGPMPPDRPMSVMYSWWIRRSSGYLSSRPGM
ncbi:FAD-dependent oxidoreductase [Nonomuraea sp. NPDC048826]|uniref:FAD-dependent oxidoreductase n=1 Tax=Nonomuraea sp. NPDC048826 TaxID=3364347 RepID=UPI003716BC14